MRSCVIGAEFWIALPTTIGALGAFIGVLRNGRRTKHVSHQLAQHTEASAARYRAYARVISDLEPRVEDLEKGE